jgi:transcriptional regulator with XRE-family HTH domain
MAELFMYRNEPSSAERGKRLKQLRGLTGLNREQFAQKATVSKTSISIWEHGREGGLSKAGAQKVICAAQDLGVICDTDWLLSGLGASPHLAAQPPKIILPATVTINREQEIAAFLQTYDDAVVIEIVDNDCLPAYRKGDKVGGLWSQVQSESLNFTEDYIVEVEGQLTIKKIANNNDSVSHYDLYNLNYNPEFIFKNVPLQRAAPVLRVWR